MVAFPFRESQKEGSPCYPGEDPLQGELSSRFQFGLSSSFFRDSSLIFVFVLVLVYVSVKMSSVIVMLFNQSRYEFVCPQERHEWEGGGDVPSGPEK